MSATTPPARRSVALLFVVASSLVLIGTQGCNTQSTGQTPPKQETVYERIIKTGKIRAGYITYPPAAIKDASGKMTGIFVETLERAAQNLGLTVQWTEEVGWGDQIAGLEADRYDIIGSPRPGELQAVEASTDPL